jgi:hypothetical protein
LRHFLDERCQRLWKLYYYRNGIRAWATEQVQRLGAGQRLENVFAPAVHINVDSSERLDLLKAQGKVKDFFPFLEHFRVGSYVSYLHRLLDWGEQHGVTVVLVDLPVPADLEERLCPQAFATYRAVLADIERTRGVRVLRASRAAVGLTDAHFADLVHLNAQGKARLSAWVRQALTTGETPSGQQVVQAK